MIGCRLRYISPQTTPDDGNRAARVTVRGNGGNSGCSRTETGKAGPRTVRHRATKPRHLPDAVAALDLRLTGEEVSALEAPYTLRAPTGF